MRRSWTFDAVEAAARNYKTKSEFIKNEPQAYQAAHRNCWIDIVGAHMQQAKNRKVSYDDLVRRAAPYKTLKEFRKGDQSAYVIARKQGVLSKITTHMLAPEPHRNQKHTKETLIADAKKYTGRTEWSRNSHSAYCAAIRLGLLDDPDVTGHMKGNKQRLKHTLSTITRDARTCSTRKEFRDQFPAAYNRAQAMGWLDRVCSHMSEEIDKTWSIKKLTKRAAQFTTRAAFKKYEPVAFKAAFDLGVLSEVMPHAKVD